MPSERYQIEPLYITIHQECLLNCARFTIGDVISAYDDVFVSRNGYASFLQAIVLGVIMRVFPGNSMFTKEVLRVKKWNVYKGNTEIKN